MWTTDELALAHRLADAADALALRHFAADDTVWRTRNDDSPVSVAVRPFMRQFSGVTARK
jgi:fructose-1,6-bisphosphatase/inositol monophosphatase family enzyme